MPSPQPRLLLALDASSSRCSAVLWSEASRASASRASAGHALAGRVLAGIEREGQTGDAARLPAMVADLLASQKLAVRDLAATAVCVGPGSFTGLRASLAFAEGLAAGAGIPVIGVTVAEALAVAASAGAPGLPLWCATGGCFSTVEARRTPGRSRLRATLRARKRRSARPATRPRR
jgi:tRNA threonylcarbamoyl adenosine modification protein YeaZ